MFRDLQKIIESFLFLGSEAVLRLFRIEILDLPLQPLPNLLAIHLAILVGHRRRLFTCPAGAPLEYLGAALFGRKIFHFLTASFGFAAPWAARPELFFNFTDSCLPFLGSQRPKLFA